MVYSLLRKVNFFPYLHVSYKREICSMHVWKGYKTITILQELLNKMDDVMSSFYFSPNLQRGTTLLLTDSVPALHTRLQLSLLVCTLLINGVQYTGSIRNIVVSVLYVHEMNIDYLVPVM